MLCFVLFLLEKNIEIWSKEWPKISQRKTRDFGVRITRGHISYYISLIRPNICYSPLIVFLLATQKKKINIVGVAANNLPPVSFAFSSTGQSSKMESDSNARFFFILFSVLWGLGFCDLWGFQCVTFF